MTTETTGAAGPGRGGRMSRRRKRDAVLRLLRGEDLEMVSRSLGVTAATLSGWRDAFLSAGEASLASRPADGEELESERLKAALVQRGVWAGPDSPPATKPLRFRACRLILQLSFSRQPPYQPVDKIGRRAQRHKILPAKLLHDAIFRVTRDAAAFCQRADMPRQPLG